MDPIDDWLARCPDPSVDPLPGMAEAGLLRPSGSYGDIARTKAMMVERTGLLGVGSIWGGRQMVGRWFIEGFGTSAQKAAWLGKTAAVSISEPEVGAHPKHLTTRAKPVSTGWRITGEKAWTSNGPIAEVLIVLAITAEEAGRKQYSMFLVPRDTPGLMLTDMPGFHALRPSRHCRVTLDRCEVPADALLGFAGSAYDLMALPFRDIEDAVGTFGTLGAIRFLLQRLRPEVDTDNQRLLSIGELVALTAVFEAAAESIVALLDKGLLDFGSATLVGLRLLGTRILRLTRDYVATYAVEDPTVATLLDDIEATFGVARGPRLARQARLGMRAPLQGHGVR
jgi:acyl-CoA dehydrogenase